MVPAGGAAPEYERAEVIRGPLNRAIAEFSRIQAVRLQLRPARHTPSHCDAAHRTQVTYEPG
ncbi:hypothetical protein Scani_53590 [Streptomyces caniferus]|uniref:Uncharacterized protein n=1 Tax=Streptomyces caniferus TaxID=285557 RepID=A0A640SF99_9ACTN|nr:hypothetical protein Scani_53590 [Streptomyces caniferus]